MKSPSSDDLAATLEAHGKRNRHPLRYLIPILLLGAAAGGGWYWYKARQAKQHQAPAYATEPLERDNIHLTITATGNLEPINKVSVGSELSGIVLEVLVDSNDRVKKGQELAKLDPSKLEQTTDRTRAALQSAKARVNQADATLKESEASLGRLQELHRLSGGKTPSKAEMDAAIATVDRAIADQLSAKAAVDEADASLRANQSDLSKTIIRSPIDGVVLTRTVEPGQTVAASFTAPELFVIAENLETMELKVSVAEADIGRVQSGQHATFTVDAWPERTYTANVSKVAFGSAVVDNVVTYSTELEVANEDLSLRPGMTATADIRVAEEKETLVVSNAALRFDPASGAPQGGADAPKKSFVQSLMPGPRRSWNRGQKPSADDKPNSRGGTARIWVLRDGKPEPLTVNTGLNDGRRTQISGDGVSEGLPVITRALTPAS